MAPATVAPRRARSWTFAASTPHDMPTFRGFVDGADLQVRFDLGLIDEHELASLPRRARRTTCGRPRPVLRDAGWLADGDFDDPAAIYRGLLRSLAASDAVDRARQPRRPVGRARTTERPRYHHERPNWRRLTRYRSTNSTMTPPSEPRWKRPSHKVTRRRRTRCLGSTDGDDGLDNDWRSRRHRSRGFSSSRAHRGSRLHGVARFARSGKGAGEGRRLQRGSPVDSAACAVSTTRPRPRPISPSSTVADSIIPTATEHAGALAGRIVVCMANLLHKTPSGLRRGVSTRRIRRRGQSSSSCRPRR